MLDSLKRAHQTWKSVHSTIQLSRPRLSQTSSCPIVSCRHAHASLTPRHHWSPASSTNSHFCKSALGQVSQPALCNSRVRSKVQLSLVTWMATGKHQQVKSARALSCVAATAMEGCSYNFLAEPIEELQHPILK